MNKKDKKLLSKIVKKADKISIVDQKDIKCNPWKYKFTEKKFTAICDYLFNKYIEQAESFHTPMSATDWLSEYRFYFKLGDKNFILRIFSRNSAFEAQVLSVLHSYPLGWNIRYKDYKQIIL